MEFITVEQFKEQPVGVQKVFLDWWETNLSEVDLIGYIGKSEAYKECFPSLGRNVAVKCFEMGIEIIPLLTEGQLRKFIEDKTGHKVDCCFYGEKYDINTCEDDGLYIKKYEDIDDDLLQAYWKVACMIAKEENKIE